MRGVPFHRRAAPALPADKPAAGRQPPAGGAVRRLLDHRAGRRRLVRQLRPARREHRPTPPRASARHTLPARSTLLFYTDGLVERRDENADHALDRLRRRTADLAREPLDTFCDELMIGLGADNADDIALHAVRPSPSPGLRRRYLDTGVAFPSARRCRLCPFGQRLVPSRLLTLRQDAVILPLVSITSRRAAR
ncbi:SpoIIE family protein phosphatase [Streptomyces olivaceus]